MANSVDPEETPRSAASHLGLNCLLRPVCPNTYGKYGNTGKGKCTKNWLTPQRTKSAQKKCTGSDLLNMTITILTGSLNSLNPSS